MIFVVAVISVRLFFIQIVEHGDWVAKADEQHTLLETIVAKRGEIYMLDNNEPVAVVLNQTAYTIIIDPEKTDIDEIEGVLKKEAKEYITVNFDDVKKMENVRYLIVAKNVPRTVAMKIADAEVGYVWFQEGNQRVYPEGEMASGLLGFVNADGIGQYGVEGSLNKRLSGTDGLLKTVADVNNVALSIGNDNIKTPAIDGENIVLTIDRSLQKGVEDLMTEAIDRTPATHAAVVIMDPNTSKVMAMASMPNYNPADYGNVTDASAYVNYTTESPYEPGSICKSFAFASAINEGKMTADSTYFNGGYEIIDGWKIQNLTQKDSLYGVITMRTALYWSLNTGSIQALKFLGGNSEMITQEGREKLYDYYYNKFRFGKETGIELIELLGYIQDPNEGYGRDSVYANMTFGQNMSVTMIQVITAFSAIVNGGWWRTPVIVSGTMQNGELVKVQRDDLVEERILSDETSLEMRDMLRYNRGYKVTGGIDPEGYEVGGKSGTAQLIINGEYDASLTRTEATYIGYGGAEGEKPGYVIMVRMWGDGEHFIDGTEHAGWLFDGLSNYMIDYLKIKPKV